MSREVAPEILDSLAPEDEAAQRSRRDLVWINRVLGSRPWFRSQLREVLRPGDRILELGAGDGRLRAAAPPGVAWDGIDRVPRPPAWPAEACWHQTDLRTFEGWAGYSVFVGNLILHHLDRDELAGLGHALNRHARIILASEPGRSQRSQVGFSVLCRLIQAHAVTRHDGRVSIEAGFRDQELPQLLGLSASDWDLRVTISPFGAYRLCARRRSSA